MGKEGLSVFNTLYEIDTRDRAVIKDTGKTSLSYLPWAVTYSEIAKNFEDVAYGFVTHPVEVTRKRVYQNEAGETIEEETKEVVEQPYMETETGLYVETWVSINGVEKRMILPVYDASYKAMKSTPYTYETKYGEKTVNGAKMDDIYKSIMRCFAKNLSMWGTGLNLWTREEAPESVLAVEKIRKDIDTIYLTKKKKGFTQEELVDIITKALPEELNGNYNLCEDLEVLEKLKKKLLALRKAN